MRGWVRTRRVVLQKLPEDESVPSTRLPVVLASIGNIKPLALGRFRLGLVPSGRAGMAQTYGINFRAPLGHLRE
jgi:hypothetical protein